MKRAILQLIDNNVKNVDKYIHNGSTWLIFTNDLNWVIEYDKNSTLWYNYKFFQTLFSYVSIDVVDYKEFITEWFESRILKINPYIEDTIQNGIKDTFAGRVEQYVIIEDTIQNGVKHTRSKLPLMMIGVEDTIQNGVKDTSFVNPYFNQNVEEIIQNGVKETKTVDDSNIMKYAVDYMYRSGLVSETVENGVKETMWRQVENYPQFVNNVIDKGVKETHHDCYGHEERIKGVILKNTK